MSMESKYEIYIFNSPIMLCIQFYILYNWKSSKIIAFSFACILITQKKFTVPCFIDILPPGISTPWNLVKTLSFNRIQLKIYKIISAQELLFYYYYFCKICPLTNYTEIWLPLIKLLWQSMRYVETLFPNCMIILLWNWCNLVLYFSLLISIKMEF